MRRVIQQDATGCGIACIAMLAGKKYEEIRKTAIKGLGFHDNGQFYTGTSDLVFLGESYGLKIGTRRRKFTGYDSLPPQAILAINYRQKSNTWHWVVFHRTASEEYILDPKKSIKTNKRKDLSRIAKKTTHWLAVEKSA